MEESGGVGLDGWGFAEAGWKGEEGEAVCGGCGAGVERETVFVGDLERLRGFAFPGLGGGCCLTGMPDTIGGGRSSPSAAFRDSCRAKSEACHHSRNLSANMEVGRRSRRLDSRRGYMMVVNVVGFQTLFVCPGRAPGLEGGIEDACSARAMAR